MPRDLVYPPDKSRDEVDKANNADFKQSEDSAEYAALGYLKYPPAVTVATVTDAGSVGGQAARPATPSTRSTARRWPTSRSSPRLLKNTKPGQVVTIDYRRKNEPAGRRARSRWAANKDRDYGFLGVAVLDAPWAPFTVDFNLANIGGPSAGLMFSLAVVDKLTTGDLAGVEVRRGHRHHHRRRQGRPDRRHHPQDGRRPRGRRDGVSGAGRQLLTRPARTTTTGLRLVKVETLGQAVDALHAIVCRWRSPRAAERSATWRAMRRVVARRDLSNRSRKSRSRRVGMRPAARMPKLTRRSRILIVIALGVIVLLLVGPRLIDAYVDWLWFGELGYRSVFTTVLVTRLVVFLVVGLLVGGIVFAGAGAGLPHPAGVRPEQRAQRSGGALPHRR